MFSGNRAVSSAQSGASFPSLGFGGQPPEDDDDGTARRSNAKHARTDEGNMPPPPTGGKTSVPRIIIRDDKGQPVTDADQGQPCSPHAHKRLRGNDGSESPRSATTARASRASLTAFHEWSKLSSDLQSVVLSFVPPSTVGRMKRVSKDTTALLTWRQSNMQGSLTLIEKMPRRTLDERRAVVVALRELGALPRDLDINALSSRKITYLSRAHAAIQQAVRDYVDIDWRLFNSIPEETLPFGSDGRGNYVTVMGMFWRAGDDEEPIQLTNGQAEWLWKALSNSGVFYGDAEALHSVFRLHANWRNTSRLFQALGRFSPQYAVQIVNEMKWHSDFFFTSHRAINHAVNMPQAHRIAFLKEMNVTLMDPFPPLIALTPGLPTTVQAEALGEWIPQRLHSIGEPEKKRVLSELITAIRRLPPDDGLLALSSLERRLRTLFSSDEGYRAVRHELLAAVQQLPPSHRDSFFA